MPNGPQAEACGSDRVAGNNQSGGLTRSPNLGTDYSFPNFGNWGMSSLSPNSEFMHNPG